MAGKVVKFADKVKKLKRTATVVFVTDDGDVVEFKIESRGDKDLDIINQKYEKLKPAVPTRKLPSKGGFKIVSNEDDPTYKSELGKVQKRQFAEMAILFLSEDERPEGEIEEQIDAVLEVELAGFVGKVVTKGLEVSGLTDKQEEYEEELVEAKND